MAELNSDTYTAQSGAADNAAKMIDTAELISGKVSFLQCKWTVPAGTANLDTVKLGFIPAGMTIIPGATVSTSAAAGSSTIVLDLELDDGTQDAAVASAVSLNTAGTSLLSTLAEPIAASNSRRTLVATLSGAITATRVIYFNIPLVNSN